jgi:uncharacterized protein (DUF4415 family)
MEIEYDEEKRRETLRTRRLDFAKAGQIFDGFHMSREDDRGDYAEIRSETNDAESFRSAELNQMNAKSTLPTTLDPKDDAPRLTREWAENAELRVGDRILREATPPNRIGRPRKPETEVRKPVSLRLSQKVLDAARATGPGWQTRAAAAIEREFLGRQRRVKKRASGG